jgi:hypothetical protein
MTRDELAACAQAVIDRAHRESLLTVTIPRPIMASHNLNGGHLVLTFRNDEDLEAAMKELGCDPR